MASSALLATTLEAIWTGGALPVQERRRLSRFAVASALGIGGSGGSCSGCSDSGSHAEPVDVIAPVDAIVRHVLEAAGMSGHTGDAVRWLRAGDQPLLAKRLQRLSRLRNAQAHPDVGLEGDVAAFLARFLGGAWVAEDPALKQAPAVVRVFSLADGGTDEDDDNGEASDTIDDVNAKNETDAGTDTSAEKGGKDEKADDKTDEKDETEEGTTDDKTDGKDGKASDTFDNFNTKIQEMITVLQNMPTINDLQRICDDVLKSSEMAQCSFPDSGIGMTKNGFSDTIDNVEPKIQDEDEEGVPPDRGNPAESGLKVDIKPKKKRRNKHQAVRVSYHPG
eukprot:CAMPEP_0204574854 /NCGR_PEP_ID=MMETSP0661-20131031/40847_1 /ASSEMBLY_ACC=CAM_ASM_000606 /TAXON_ID=109239 /ORGANISM="Alexandrium margalefi, Strain AMGDE01CS-322" /LENGTH=335 /DNA_ID=CAMNT_0051583423 /DNA_START=38 /DNA_END=1045 /DNA_ORIENTATION=+